LISRLARLVQNSGFVFLLGLAAGMTAPGGAAQTEQALLPVLGVIMTVSILDVSLKTFTNVRQIAAPATLALALNYVVLSGTIIGLSSLIIDDADMRHGFVLAAAVPPAVAVIPLTYMLAGNTRLSLIGNVAAYIAALGITPLISVLFLGSNFVDPVRLLIVLGELIVLPLIVSRILRRTPVMAGLDKWRPYLVNWGFFLVIYTIVGLNRDSFLAEPGDLALPAIVAFTATFVLAEVVNRISGLFGAGKADRTSLMLFASRKNDGLAGAIALLFLGTRAAMPVAVLSTMTVIHFIWLNWWVKKMR
jgi:BASS family bile acid:Na+ symporter